MAIKRVFKWWWSWNPSKIEIFLEKKALEGWRLMNTKFAMTIFEFKRDEPIKVRYTMDYDYKNKINEEYMTIAEDDGWEFVDRSAGWIMWRKQYEAERPDFFTDNQSIIDRNKRLLRFLFVLSMLQVPILLMNFIDRDYSDHFFTSIAILCVYLPSVALLFYGVIRLFYANRALKKDGRR